MVRASDQKSLTNGPHMKIMYDMNYDRSALMVYTIRLFRILMLIKIIVTCYKVSFVSAYVKIVFAFLIYLYVRSQYLCLTIYDSRKIYNNLQVKYITQELYGTILIYVRAEITLRINWLLQLISGFAPFDFADVY